MRAILIITSLLATVVFSFNNAIAKEAEPNTLVTQAITNDTQQFMGFLLGHAHGCTFLDGTTNEEKAKYKQVVIKILMQHHSVGAGSFSSLMTTAQPIIDEYVDDNDFLSAGEIHMKYSGMCEYVLSLEKLL